MALVSLPSRPSGLLNRYAARYSRKRFGLVADPVKAASHHTGVLLAQGAEEMVVDKKWTRLDSGVRWLAVMVAAQQVGCSWCIDFGWYEGVATGVDPAKIRAVGAWRGSELFDERERAALEYAEAASATPVQIEDELADRLRAHFREDELVELAGYIALENQRSRFNAALGLQSQGFKNQCELPDAEGRSSGQAPVSGRRPQEAAHV
jgi:AhpD family alkylhydroperoxidase